jgi:hypothetical protein
MKALVGFLALVVSSAALACSCGDWDNGKLMVKGSAGAFIGFPNTSSVITDIVVDGDQLQRTPFVVLRNFKSTRFMRTINVYTTKDDGANCGVDFTAMMGVYLIFADVFEGKLIANGCGLSSVDDSRSIKALSEITL